MTVPIDALLTSTIGVACYTAARKHLALYRPLPEEAVPAGAPTETADQSHPNTRSLLAGPYFLWGMAYNVLVGMGIAFTAYRINSDWMWMYWLDASRLSPAFTAYVFLMYPAFYTLGFLLADQADRLRNRGAGTLLIILLASLAAFIVLSFERLWQVGTTAQWDAKACLPMIGPGFSPTPLAWSLLIGLAVALASGAFLLKKFSRGLN